MRQDIERLKIVLEFVDIALMPIIVARRGAGARRAAAAALASSPAGGGLREAAMRKSTFLLLVLATVVFVAGAASAVLSGERAAAPLSGQRALPDLAARLGSLAWMRLSQGSKRTDFTAIGGRWVVVEKGNYPANAGKVRRLLLGLADLTLVEPKTRRPELLPRLDLDDPSNGRSTLVRLQGRTGGTVAELIVGKIGATGWAAAMTASMCASRATSRPGSPAARSNCRATCDGWLDRRIVDLPASRVAAAR